MLKEFRQFILRGNVVDLAVGVVIGAAFKTIVDALVLGVITPLISLPGTANLSRMEFCVGTKPVKGVPECAHPFAYGAVIDAVLSFVIVAAVVFIFIVKPVNHLMARFKLGERGDETTRECPECLSRIPHAARRCSFCSVEIGAAI